VLDEDAGRASVSVVLGTPFEESDELELPGVEDELPDNDELVLISVAVFELASLDLGTGETVELDAAEVGIEDAGTGLLVASVEDPTVELAFSTAVLDDELRMLD
jgi:hypothetical protein